MSWEGYYQLICKNGHYYIAPAEFYQPEDHPCLVCKEKPIWYNTVDITNGSFDEEGHRIDGAIELKPYKIIKCKHCHSTLEAKYKIPKKKGHNRV